jgi:superfamily I DNA/RNA helicase
VFEPVVKQLAESGRSTMAGVYGRLAALYTGGARPPFDFVIVDEAQDLSVPQMRFLASLGAGRSNGLFFAGDLGQRIFQLPFSWKSLGVDVRGRSHTLRVNYRTSHQIRGRTDRLLPPELSDVDGNVEHRWSTISVFSGPEPEIHVFGDEGAETQAAAAWLRERAQEGMAPHEIGVFVRSLEQLDRGVAPLIEAGIPYVVLDERLKTLSGHGSLATMHLAKGLEFKAVAVLACDDEVIPLQFRLSAITDAADLEDVYNTERHLLYVACTRARDRLFVSGARPASEFLEDLRVG